MPAASDAVVIPAGKTVSITDGDNPGAASLTLKGGTLALGDASELDTGDFAAIGGGTISGPQYALLQVQLDDGVQATVDAGGPDRRRRLSQPDRHRHLRRGRAAGS